MEAFPYVEFPLFSSGDQAAGQQRQYLASRINCAAAGSFSAAAVSRSGELTFRRNGELTSRADVTLRIVTSALSSVKGRYVNYHTPCLPLALPNTRQ